MERRRSLNSISGGGGDMFPESTIFEFPLYFNTEIVLEQDNYGIRENYNTILQDLDEWANNITNHPNSAFETEVPLIGGSGYEIFIDGKEVERAYIVERVLWLVFKNAPVDYGNGYTADEACVLKYEGYILTVDVFKN